MKVGAGARYSAKVMCVDAQCCSLQYSAPAGAKVGNWLPALGAHGCSHESTSESIRHLTCDCEGHQTVSRNRVVNVKEYAEADKLQQRS